MRRLGIVGLFVLGACSESSGPADAGGLDAAADADAEVADVPDAGPIDITAQSDEFDGTTLSRSWSHHFPHAIVEEVSGGALHETLNQSALWHDASQAPLVWKSIDGDFKVSARVRARRASSPDLAADGVDHRGGLMARHRGAASGESHVLVVVGHGQTELDVEVKTTEGSVSTAERASWPSSDAELRICRVGSTFVLYKRALDASAWIEAGRYDRPDLPSQLQVGMIAYAVSSTGAPDLRASYDWIRFALPRTLADCDSDP